MATILGPTERVTNAQKKAMTTVYLAGPFDEDGGRSWRDEVIDALDDLDVVVIDPRNERWSELEADSPGRRGAYDWQCSMAFDADVVVVWVPAGSHAPTALMILGYLGAKRSNARRGSSVVVGGDGCDGLVRLFAQNQRLFPVGSELADLIRISHIQADEAVRAKADA